MDSTLFEFGWVVSVDLWLSVPHMQIGFLVLEVTHTV